MTIEKAINEYLEWKRGYAKPASVAYAPCLKRFATIKNTLEKIEQLDIVRFLEREALRIKPITLTWYVSIIKDFFGYYRCQINPKLIRKPKFTPEPRQYVTEEEFEKMDKTLNEWEFYQLRKKVALHLLWHTGIRVSELCDINLADIENSKNCAKIITKKNLKHRWIMWSGEAHQLLMRYIGTKISLGQHPALFSEAGKRISQRTIQRWVKEISKKAGIERRIHPHMFRHGKAHKMLKYGANLNDVKTILGHTTILSTQAYTGLFQEEFEGIAQKYV